MNDHRFQFHGETLCALPSGALWWPSQGLLTVSDLHLGKSDRIARRTGGILPPYDGHDTLTRLQGDLDSTGAARVICLGDSFDDTAAAAALSEDLHLWITRMTAGRDWIWVQGNHDPGPVDLPGSHRAAVRVGALAFRHIATGAAAEISGHYHPKARLSLRGASVSRPCFLIDGMRIVLPAYGTYTGGLCTTAPELCALMAPDALAVLTGLTARPVPMPRARALRRHA